MYFVAFVSLCILSLFLQRIIAEPVLPIDARPLLEEISAQHLVQSIYKLLNWDKMRIAYKYEYLSNPKTEISEDGSNVLKGSDGKTEYIIGRYICSGSHGDVHLAKVKGTNKYVAVKLENIRPRDSPLTWESKLYTLMGENVALLSIRDFVPEWNDGKKKVNALVMDLLGCAISNRLEKHDQLSTRTTALLVKQLFEGLQYIHTKNVLHTDLFKNTENMGIGHSQNNGDKFVKIIDFGVSLEFRNNYYYGRDDKAVLSGSAINEEKELGSFITRVAGNSPDTLRELEGVIEALGKHSIKNQNVNTALNNLYTQKGYADDGVFDWTPSTKFTFLASALAIELLKTSATSGYGMGEDYTASYKSVPLTPDQQSSKAILQGVITAELDNFIKTEFTKENIGRKPVFPLKIKRSLEIEGRWLFAEIESLNDENMLGDVKSSHVRGFGVAGEILGNKLMLVLYYYTPDLDKYTRCWDDVWEQEDSRKRLGGNHPLENSGLTSSLNFAAQEIGKKLLETGGDFGYGASRDFVARYIKLDQWLTDDQVREILSKSKERFPSTPRQEGIEGALKELADTTGASTPHPTQKILFNVEGEEFLEFGTGVLPLKLREKLSPDLGIAVAVDGNGNAILVAVHFHPDIAMTLLK